MAIDIQGRKPSSPLGKNWHVEFWVWRPIHALIVRLCPDLFDKKSLENMAFGRGAGATDERTCLEMAKRFEHWMRQHPEGFVLESGIRATEDGRIVSEQELAENPSLETVSPYEAGESDLRKWIEFLKGCGGFEVW
jgi:hypothetical protein